MKLFKEKPWFAPFPQALLAQSTSCEELGCLSYIILGCGGGRLNSKFDYVCASLFDHPGWSFEHCHNGFINLSHDYLVDYWNDSPGVRKGDLQSWMVR